MDENVESIPLLNRCPECEQDINVSALGPFAKITCPHCASSVRVRTTMGQYQISQLLGEGGMSQVFKAVDVHLNREVALKILHQALSRDETLTSMFEREAKLTASILHPNVVKVYKVGNDQGYFFIAMELVETTSLEQLIASDGSLAEGKVLDIAHDVTSGLRAANEEGLIHRDIKPGNMLVTGDGTTKLVDFGLAVHQDGADESEDLWATPFYVPPEKLDGEPDTYLGDIYSLGATLYHALAGKPPFEANTNSMDELKLIKENPVDLKSDAPGVSKPTVKLVEKMMAYRPEDRHQSYLELLDEIEEVQRKVIGVDSHRRKSGNKKNPALVIAGLALLLIIIAGAAALFPKKETVPEEVLELGSGERVISRGENRNAELFLRGRKELAAGNLVAASDAFSKLEEKKDLPPLTDGWTHYFTGLIFLLEGREFESREHFAKVLQIDRSEAPEDEDETEVLVFLARSANNLASPLPVMGGGIGIDSDSVEAIALVAAGLKNWHLGEFESAFFFLDEYSKSNIPPEVDWLEGFQDQIVPYFFDFELLQKLPNPSRKSSEDFTEEKTALENALGKVRTRHALPKLIKERLQRIDSIASLVAEEQAKSQEMASNQVASEKGTEKPRRPKKDDGIGPKESEEIDSLKAFLTEQGSLIGTMRFALVAEKLSDVELETDFAKSMRDQLAQVFSSADDYRSVLATRLNSGEYEGTVRRKEGKPLDAAITAATSVIFTVDLGFGPNEVEVEKFASDWLLEAGEEVLPELSDSTVSEWETLVCFALATGETEAFQRLAPRLASQSAEFAERMKILRELR